MKIQDYARAQGWYRKNAAAPNSHGVWKAFVQDVKDTEQDILMASAETDAIIQTINDKFGPGTMFPASQASQPPMTDQQAIFEWEERNKKAYGGRIGFMSGKSANQYGPFTTKSKIGAPTTGETISKAEFNKIKKLLKDRPGIGIYPTQREGAYTIKVKVEKGGKIIQEDLLYSKDNLDTMLKKWQSARDQLFPNQITDAKYLELRLSNPTLTQDQFANLLNEGEYLSSKGNKFTNPVVFKWDKRLKVHDLSSEIRGAEKRTIKEAEQIVKEKFGKDFKKIFKTDKEIRAKATQLINDKGKFKGSFPRGAGAEDFLWHAYNRAASQGSKQITYDLSALGYELPMEDGKINWNKKINGTPAWKLVKFKDNDVGKTFSYNEKNGKHIIGDLKNQVNTAYNNTNKFNNSVKGFYEQAGISEKFKNAARDNFLIKELESKLGRSITKADDELVKNWLKERRPGFSLTQVHHPEGVAKNVYNTQNVVRAANLAERDLTKTYNSEVKTLGEAEAKKNYKKNLQIVSDEFGGIQSKFEGEKRYVGDAPTVQSIEDHINKLTGGDPKLNKFVSQNFMPSGPAGAFEMLSDDLKKIVNSEGFKTWKAKIANPALTAAGKAARLPTKIFGVADLALGYLDYSNNRQKGWSKEDSKAHMIETLLFGFGNMGEEADMAGVKKVAMEKYNMSSEVFDQLVAANKNQNEVKQIITDFAKQNKDAQERIDSGLADEVGESLILLKNKNDGQKRLQVLMKEAIEREPSLKTNLQIQEAGAPININVDKGKALGDLSKASYDFVQQRIKDSDLEKLASQKDTTKGGIGDTAWNTLQGLWTYPKFAYDLVNPFSPLPKMDDWKTKGMKHKDQMEKLKKEDPELYYKMLLSEGVDPRMDMNLPVHLEWEQKYPYYGTPISDEIKKSTSYFDGGIASLRRKK